MKQLDLESFNDFNPEAIARRMLVDNPAIRVVLVSLRAGQSLPEHSSAGLVTIVSLSGRVEFREDGQCCELTPGRFVYLSPGSRHAVAAREDSRLLVTMVKPSDAATWEALSPAGTGIDLRATPHSRRHGIIFWAFDALAPGESFILINDHDPQPLRMQMDLLRPGELSWEYLTKGPAEFRVKLSRIAAPAKAQEETKLLAGAAASSSQEN